MGRNRKGKEWMNSRGKKREREGKEERERMEEWYGGNRKGKERRKRKEWRNGREETGKGRKGGKEKNGGMVGRKQEREEAELSGRKQ